MPARSRSGNTTPARIPIFRLSFNAPDTMPTTVGPPEQPTSPASARSANIAVPPRAMEAVALLKEPGHIIPTDRPHKAQPANPTTGLGTREMHKIGRAHV